MKVRRLKCLMRENSDFVDSHFLEFLDLRGIFLLFNILVFPRTNCNYKRVGFISVSSKFTLKYQYNIKLKVLFALEKNMGPNPSYRCHRFYKNHNMN